MRFVRRLIAWSFFASLLTAVGAGVFHFIRCYPRCTVEGPMVPRHLSPDGRWLVGLAISEGPPRDFRAPEVLALRVFDAQSGRLVRSLLASALDCAQSPDGRHFLWQQKDDTLQIADWQAGSNWSVPVMGRRDGLAKRIFSPRSRWLWIDVDRAEGRNVVLDLKERKPALWPGDFLPEFTPDDRYGLCLIDNGSISVVELETGRTIALLRPEFTMDRVGVRFSSDGRRAVFGNVRSPESRKTSPEVLWEACEPIEQFVFLNLEVWDLVEFRRVWAWKPAADTEFGSPALSADGQRLAYWTSTKQGPRLEMVDLTSGAVHLVYADSAVNGYRRRLRFLDGPSDQSTSGNEVMLLTNDATPSFMSITADGRVVWREQGNGYITRSKGGTIIRAGDDLEQYKAVNLRTGQSCGISLHNFHERQGCSRALSADGRRFAIIGSDFRPPPPPGSIEEWLQSKWPQLFKSGRAGVVVMDTATGRECLRLLRSDIDGIHISADGETLMTMHSKDGPFNGENLAPGWVVHRVDLWDVPATRAWIWAIGSALALGIGLLLVRRWRLKRKAAV